MWHLAQIRKNSNDEWKTIDAFERLADAVMCIIKIEELSHQGLHLEMPVFEWDNDEDVRRYFEYTGKNYCYGIKWKVH